MVAQLPYNCDAMIIKTQGGIQKRIDKKNQQWDENSLEYIEWF